MKNSSRFLKGMVPWNKGKTGIYSPETIAKIKAGRAKQVFSDEYKKKMSDTLRGRKNTWGGKISATRKKKFQEQGYLNTPETRAKISHSIKTSEKSVASFTSPQRIEKIRISSTGRRHSDATRNKISESLTGKKRTEQSIQNIKNALSKITPERREAMTIKMMETQKKNRTSSSSKIEVLILDRLQKEFGVPIERQFRIGRKSFDGKIGNILIEIDGERWHSTPEAVKRDSEKDKLATSLGYIMLRIRIARGFKLRKLLENSIEKLSLIISRKAV